MTKRTSTRPGRSGISVKVSKRRQRPDVVHSSVYLPRAVYEALREVAFKERRKIHDIVLEGIAAALKKRGYDTGGTRKWISRRRIQATQDDEAANWVGQKKKGPGMRARTLPEVKEVGPDRETRLQEN
jgi:hypothetical protein